ncbi:TPA: hypothetical protein ACPQLG_001910, partial [Haemophilus influenzae]
TPKPTGASLSFSLPGKRLTHQSATNLYRYRYRPPLWSPLPPQLRQTTQPMYGKHPSLHSRKCRTPYVRTRY